MLTVEWLESAVQDVIEITSYIAQFDPVAAMDMTDLFEVTAEKIPDQPYTGRPGRELGTREKIPHPRYVMVYRITNSSIQIVNVLHTSKQYPFSMD
ncbi:hypothetical protein GCM10023206_26430 [Acinetobacter puyangensis]|uniref:Plasmid stabilization system protein ParE n=1 Tax=Acinetobacter puyangensis TaxID=1096779 RepID=A0A240E4A3_9GAMM|nr:type II toxin-antitoxin system RelE/ParE family toxin [Acinetobacter puyangensis]SNX43587.1 Plasmid stabilization system protein ParE [Acinetobacter puyangensis]